MTEAREPVRRFVVLLRGVNVGGVRFAMLELRHALEAAGFGRVATVLASGNVVLDAPGTVTADLADRVSAVIRERFGFDVAAIAVEASAIGEAIDGYPFEVAADRHAYVVFGATRAALEELVAAAGELDPQLERVAPGNGVLYWDAPKGETLRTAFGRQYGRRQRSGAVTTRNRRTLQAIAAVL